MNTLANRPLLSCAAALLLSLPAAALAAPHSGPFIASAKVVRVEPLVRVVEVTRPQEVCWEEAVAYTRPRSHTPKILGGILGGVVGNQFGSGRGRDAMTIAGALLGASIGGDAARERAARGADVRYEQRCAIEQVRVTEERQDGFRVTYIYGGREFVTRTATDPGNRISIRVRVQPVAYNERQRADWSARPASRSPA